jgi:outer membrane protein OmpA-like peptidoglycan-associated protein
LNAVAKDKRIARGQGVQRGGFADLMIVPSPSRALGTVALVGGLLVAACSSDKDVPPTVASAPNGGTQINTDTGSGGSFPDINSVPTQRPSSTIQDLSMAPEGLSGASNGTQYGEALVGGPTSSAQPPAPPPPPPEPAPEQQPAPAADAGSEASGSGASGAPEPAPAPAESMAAAPEPESAVPEAPVPEAAPAPSSEPIATPEITEPEPMEPAAEGAPQYGEASPAPEPAAPAPPASQGQTPEPEAVQQPTEPAPDGASTNPAPAAPPEAEAPAPAQAPAQPQDQVALAPVAPPAPASGPSAPNYAPSSPEAYGISPPNPASPPYQGPAPAPANYGAPVATTAYANYGQPIGLIYFPENSYELSSDDREVLGQIAGLQRSHGGIVHVVGHASMTTGAAEANQRISQARAQAVADQLIEDGVPREAIRTVAAGDAQPLYSESMPSGEAGNRRADVYLGAY